MSKKRDAKRFKNKKSYEISNNESASLSSRFKAFLTDTFLIATPIFYIVIYLIMGSGEEFAKSRSLGWSIIILSLLAIITFFWYVKMQTPGMRAYKLKIVDNITKQRITFIQALSRFMITLFAIISFFLLFVPFFRKDKKTIQDIFSNTIIINIP